MVGLNHEFARELLWREYPTDQRGSTFRQFWDRARVLRRRERSATRRCKESLRDIPPLHRGRRPADSAITINRDQPARRTRTSSCW